MKNKITKKHFDYLVLLLASIIAIMLVITNSANKQLVSMIVVSYAAFYFVWGMIHHKFEASLHTEVVFEYLIYSALGALLIIGLT